FLWEHHLQWFLPETPCRATPSGYKYGYSCTQDPDLKNGLPVSLITRLPVR
ncbi:MAG: hypothetical protein ACI9A2_001207, partial [Halioglobus sp.]